MRQALLQHHIERCPAAKEALAAENFNRPSLVTDHSSLGSTAPAPVLDETVGLCASSGSNAGTFPCAVCGRTFAADRLGKHQRICRANANSYPRQVYNASAKRNEDLKEDLERASLNVEPRSSSRTPKKDWRQARSEFRQAARRDAARARNLDKMGSVQVAQWEDSTGRVHTADEMMDIGTYGGASEDCAGPDASAGGYALDSAGADASAGAGRFEPPHWQRPQQEEPNLQSSSRKVLPTVSVGNPASGLAHMINDPYFPGEQVEVVPTRRDPGFSPYEYNGTTMSDAYNEECAEDDLAMTSRRLIDIPMQEDAFTDELVVTVQNVGATELPDGDVSFSGNSGSKMCTEPPFNFQGRAHEEEQWLSNEPFADQAEGMPIAQEEIHRPQYHLEQEHDIHARDQSDDRHLHHRRQNSNQAQQAYDELLQQEEHWNRTTNDLALSETLEYEDETKPREEEARHVADNTASIANAKHKEPDRGPAPPAEAFFVELEGSKNWEAALERRKEWIRRKLEKNVEKRDEKNAERKRGEKPGLDGRRLSGQQASRQGQGVPKGLPASRISARRSATQSSSASASECESGTSNSVREEAEFSSDWETASTQGSFASELTPPPSCKRGQLSNKSTPLNSTPGSQTNSARNLATPVQPRRSSPDESQRRRNPARPSHPTNATPKAMTPKRHSTTPIQSAPRSTGMSSGPNSASRVDGRSGLGADAGQRSGPRTSPSPGSSARASASNNSDKNGYAANAKANAAEYFAQLRRSASERNPDKSAFSEESALPKNEAAQADKAAGVVAEPEMFPSQLRQPRDHRNTRGTNANRGIKPPAAIAAKTSEQGLEDIPEKESEVLKPLSSRLVAQGLTQPDSHSGATLNEQLPDDSCAADQHPDSPILSCLGGQNLTPNERAVSYLLPTDFKKPAVGGDHDGGANRIQDVDLQSPILRSISKLSTGLFQQWAEDKELQDRNLSLPPPPVFTPGQPKEPAPVTPTKSKSGSLNLRLDTLAERVMNADHHTGGRNSVGGGGSTGVQNGEKSPQALTQNRPPKPPERCSAVTSPRRSANSPRTLSRSKSGMSPRARNERIVEKSPRWRNETESTTVEPTPTATDEGDCGLSPRSQTTTVAPSTCTPDPSLAPPSPRVQQSPMFLVRKVQPWMVNQDKQRMRPMASSSEASLQYHHAEVAGPRQTLPTGWPPRAVDVELRPGGDNTRSYSTMSMSPGGPQYPSTAPSSIATSPRQLPRQLRTGSPCVRMEGASNAMQGGFQVQGSMQALNVGAPLPQSQRTPQTAQYRAPTPPPLMMGSSSMGSMHGSGSGIGSAHAHPPGGAMQGMQGVRSSTGSLTTYGNSPQFRGVPYLLGGQR